MKTTKRLLMVIGVIALFNFQAQADQVPDKCFTKEVVQELAQHFTQLNTYIDANREQVCQSQTGARWATLIETLIDLKDIQLEEEIHYPTQDDFSFRAIPDNGWWAYFIERANQFDLAGTRCSPQVVAYVVPFIRGVVNLCDAFYKEDRITRAEVLLHEVRHFEGFGHVTCTHGADKGSQGACDQSLPQKGSYAVSMQAEITLGLRGKNFNEAEKALGRAQALYLLQNRFNEPTDVKIRESLYLENAQGEVYDWNPKETTGPRFIKKLSAPAKVYTSSLDTIIYPLDVNLPAYRMTEDLSSLSSSLGMYADAYNKKTPSERGAYKAIGYQTDGGYLTESGISTICGSGIVELKSSEFPENMATLVTLEREVQNPVNLLVGESGQLYRLNCMSGMGMTSLTALNIYVPSGLERAFLVGNQRYALTKEGQIYVLTKNGSQYQLGENIKFSGMNENWIEMAVRTMPYLFDDVKNAQQIGAMN